MQMIDYLLVKRNLYFI